MSYIDRGDRIGIFFGSETPAARQDAEDALLELLESGYMDPEIDPVDGGNIVHNALGPGDVAIDLSIQRSLGQDPRPDRNEP